MKLRSLWVSLVTLLSNHLSSGYTESSSAMKLEQVQVLFRHGERTPQKYEYNLLNSNDLSVYEPFGLEHLTNRGKMQAYKVGNMLKERYKNFLNDTSSTRDIYARSSENPRTRMTLQLVLAGLFPPSEELRWHPELNWIPIPYRYVPADMDALLKTQEADKFKQLYSDVWKTSWGLEKLALYKDIFEFLSKLGIEANTNDITDIAVVHNILLINERMSVPLPDWYTDEMKRRLEQAFEIFHDGLSYTQQLKRLNGGPLVKTFINNMNLDGSVENPKKLYLYSGHDLNVGAVIRALNVDGFENTDFCSTLILEKLRHSNNKVYVRLLHWNGIKEELTTARIGDSEEFCPIDRFLKLTRDIIPTDEELFSMYDKFDINSVKRFFH